MFSEVLAELLPPGKVKAAAARPGFRAPSHAARARFDADGLISHAVEVWNLAELLKQVGALPN